MGTWDMVVVGSGGGPDETNLSAYLLKPSDASWEEGTVALEAGSGMGALNRIVKSKPDLFGHRPDTKEYYSAYHIYSSVQCFLITHAHLDHVSSLVMSSGSLGGSRKRIHATQPVLKDFETIFADRLWPNLASWNEEDDLHKSLYSIICSDTQYYKICNDTSVRSMPLSHGRYDASGVYESTAFFIRHDPSGQEFLFFGDVEPDSMAENPLTIYVWREAASKIPQTLSCIFIECSWPSGRRDDQLYGHLTPEHLVAELKALAVEIVKFREAGSQEPLTDNTKGPWPMRKKKKPNPILPEDLRGVLTGVNIHVIHCKDVMDSTSDRPINHIITDQIKALVVESGLGAEVLPVDQGVKIEF